MTNTCRSCGLCCKLFLINLTKQEYYSGQYQTIFQEFGIIANFSQAKACGANLLAKNPDGSCIYLKDNHCSIHDHRPAVCRPFFCTSKSQKFQSMIAIINSQKKSK